MALYKSTNVDHPMDQLEKTVSTLVSTVDSIEQKVSKLEESRHDHEHTPIATEPETQHHPDPVKHKYISFAKSAVRIAAGLCLIWPGSLILAGVFLIAAEVLGVAEEMV
jgi:hypothetical protein